MQQREPERLDLVGGPHPEAFAGEIPIDARHVGDDDDVPDAPAAPPARRGGPGHRPGWVDPRLLDPDVKERARRVEIYRRMIEEDPLTSLFVRRDSPPRRQAPVPRII
ncbi:MAG: hypothetical protein M9894_13895 [Planctomycetes bacterium]|nr:hypothetical protein [Planctomycetota bacterium]